MEIETGPANNHQDGGEMRVLIDRFTLQMAIFNKPANTEIAHEHLDVGMQGLRVERSAHSLGSQESWLGHENIAIDRDGGPMLGLPTIIVVAVALIVSALVVGVVHVVAESVDIVSPALDSANTVSNKASNVLGHIFDILLSIIPAILHAVLGAVVVVLDVLGDVFDFSDLCGE
ncbi:hypothetical protein KCU70_g344, partial [Aureobasidium melanogenum]